MASARVSTTEPEVRSLEYYQRGLEVCQRELEVYKALYWGLQVKLDGIDTIRKSDPYCALRRYNAMEKHIAEYKRTHGDKEEEIRSNSESDEGYDCVGGTTVSSEPNPHKAPYWELQDEMDKVESMRTKNIRYAALRRQKALEKLGLIFGGGESRSDVDRDEID